MTRRDECQRNTSQWWSRFPIWGNKWKMSKRRTRAFMRKLLPAETNIAGQVDIIKNRFDDRNTLRLTFPTYHPPTPSSCFHKCLSQCFDYGLGTGGTFGWVATEHSLYCNCRHHHHHQQGNTSWIVYRVGGEGLRAAGRKLVYCVYSSCGNIRSKPQP